MRQCMPAVFRAVAHSRVSRGANFREKNWREDMSEELYQISIQLNGAPRTFQVTQEETLLHLLREAGMDVPLTGLTVDECADTICRAFGGAEGK